MNLRGAYTALITPFRNGEVDVDALRDLVERQIDGGIDGLVPCGTTGEAATMTAEEQLLVIRTVVDAAEGRVPIIAGTGSNDTRKTVEFTREVAQIDGVDAALVVVPYYNKPDQEGLFRHFTQVADEGGLPVVLYNVPGRTVRSFTPATVGRLADHDNIIAIKEATGDMAFDTEVLEAVEGKINVMSGDDFTTFPLVACGGTGCVSVVSNLDPTSMSRMCEATLEGDFETARRLHMKIQPLARALFSAPNPVPTKTIASKLGWCTPEVRAPLYDVSDEVRATLEKVASDYGFEG
ncbi:4-hydroxy-tetrahydrodipicolinate synthase [Persicimonas caeni]|uniref:4-hydroxy-tetrahydrodipicolinate synthase n=1 Tax=Persicimonas caeni TaxID=2292766 RepID=A0A4Y6Q267_PERCE|nr:4-hydroxy-tetrahydrodipicolinate synthase [Persicimonas caeni]QDG54277.1 4-hydroxy-tetrahydrodipicolinate synthase [Persicimonas caeni]QED35498.1 4-hydroxy-tetrahydrodipicolinate synthase [Persicimonas caeni]